MALLSAKRTILAKIESSYGSDSSPTATDGIIVKNLDLVGLNSEVVSRELVRGFWGASEQVIANTSVQISFDVEMAGGGSAGTTPQYDALLRACGMSKTVTSGVKVSYTPVSTGIESVTLYVNNDGVLHKVLGCRGTFECTMQAGQIPTFRFSFTGKYSTPVDSAITNVDYTGFQVPLAVNQTNTTLSFFSYSAKASNLTLNYGSNVVYRNLVNSNEVILTDRNITGNVTFEAVNVATKDFFTLATGRTSGALDVTHGTATGNKVRLISSKVDITQATYAEDNGILMMNVPFVMVPTAAGNEFTVEVL